MSSVSKLPFETQFLDGLLAGGRQRSRLERLLYEQYSYLIDRASRQHRLSLDECASAYSDTVLAVIAQIANGFFDGRSSVKTYLHRIFTNKCVDYLREKQKRRNRVYQTQTLDDALLSLPDPARSVVDRLIAQYEVNALRHQLGQLGAQKRALILAWGEGYSDEELARQFGYRSAAVAKTMRLRYLRQFHTGLATKQLNKKIYQTFV